MLYYNKLVGAMFETNEEAVNAAVAELNLKLENDDVTEYDAIVAMAKYSGAKVDKSIQKSEALKHYCIVWVDYAYPLLVNAKYFEYNGKRYVEIV